MRGGEGPRIVPRPRDPSDCRATSPRQLLAGYVVCGGAPAAWIIFNGLVAAPRSGLAEALIVAAGLAVGVGVGALAAAGERSQRRRREARIAQHRGGFWNVDNAWDPKGITVVHAGAKRRGRWIEWAPIPLMAAAFIAVIVLRREIGPPVPWILFGIAGSFVVWCVWRMAHASSRGRSHLAFGTFPFFPGERVAMTFGVDEGGANFEAVRYVLRCYDEGPGGAGGLSVRSRVSFESEFVAPEGILPGPDRFVSLAFDVPAGAHGTALSARWPTYWELEVVGETNRGPYRVLFRIPIYDRPAAAAAPSTAS